MLASTKVPSKYNFVHAKWMFDQSHTSVLVHMTKRALKKISEIDEDPRCFAGRHAGTGIDGAGHIVERRAHELRLSNADPSRSIGRISVDVVNTRARFA